MEDTTIERRIAAIERRQQELDARLLELHQQIEENTKTTNAIKADTAQIVAFFKASTLGAAIIKWMATVGGSAIIAYAAFKGLSGR